MKIADKVLAELKARYEQIYKHKILDATHTANGINELKTIQQKATQYVNQLDVATQIIDITKRIDTVICPWLETNIPDAVLDDVARISIEFTGNSEYDDDGSFHWYTSCNNVEIEAPVLNDEQIVQLNKTIKKHIDSSWNDKFMVNPEHYEFTQVVVIIDLKLVRQYIQYQSITLEEVVSAYQVTHA